MSERIEELGEGVGGGRDSRGDIYQLTHLLPLLQFCEDCRDIVYNEALCEDWTGQENIFFLLSPGLQSTLMTRPEPYLQFDR